MAARAQWRDLILSFVPGSSTDSTGLVTFAARDLVAFLLGCGRCLSRQAAAELGDCLRQRDIVRPASPGTDCRFTDSGVRWICRAGEEAPCFSSPSLLSTSGYVMAATFLKQGALFVNPRWFLLDRSTRRLYVYTSETSASPRYYVDFTQTPCTLLLLRPGAPQPLAVSDEDGEDTDTDEEQGGNGAVVSRNFMGMSSSSSWGFVLSTNSTRIVAYTPSEKRARGWAAALAATAVGLSPRHTISHYQQKLGRTNVAPPLLLPTRRQDMSFLPPKADGEHAISVITNGTLQLELPRSVRDLLGVTHSQLRTIVPSTWASDYAALLVNNQQIDDGRRQALNVSWAQVAEDDLENEQIASADRLVASYELIMDTYCKLMGPAMGLQPLQQSLMAHLPQHKGASADLRPLRLLVLEPWRLDADIGVFIPAHARAIVERCAALVPLLPFEIEEESDEKTGRGMPLIREHSISCLPDGATLKRSPSKLQGLTLAREASATALRKRSSRGLSLSSPQQRSLNVLPSTDLFEAQRSLVQVKLSTIMSEVDTSRGWLINSDKLSIAVGSERLHAVGLPSYGSGHITGSSGNGSMAMASLPSWAGLEPLACENWATRLLQVATSASLAFQGYTTWRDILIGRVLPRVGAFVVRDRASSMLTAVIAHNSDRRQATRQRSLSIDGGSLCTTSEMSGEGRQGPHASGSHSNGHDPIHQQAKQPELDGSNRINVQERVCNRRRRNSTTASLRKVRPCGAPRPGGGRTHRSALSSDSARISDITINHFKGMMTEHAVKVLLKGNHPLALHLQGAVSSLQSVYGPEMISRLGIIFNTPGLDFDDHDGLPAGDASAFLKSDLEPLMQAIGAAMHEWPASWLTSIADWGTTGCYMKPSVTFAEALHNPKLASTQLEEGLLVAWQAACQITRIISLTERDISDICITAVQRVVFSSSGLGESARSLYMAAYCGDNEALHRSCTVLAGITATQLELDLELRVDRSEKLGAVIGLDEKSTVTNNVLVLHCHTDPQVQAVMLQQWPWLPSAAASHIRLCASAGAGLPLHVLPVYRLTEDMYADTGDAKVTVTSFPDYASGTAHSPAAQAFFMPSVELLRQLPNLSAPADKIRALVAAVDTLCRGVSLHRMAVSAAERCTATGSVRDLNTEEKTDAVALDNSQLTADDLLALLCLTVIALCSSTDNGVVVNLASELAILSDFAGEEVMMERPGFYLTSLQAALIYAVGDDIVSRVRCGQCEESPSELYCAACGRQLCCSCDSSIHSGGGSTVHHVRILKPDTPGETATVGKLSASSRTGASRLSRARTLSTAAHTMWLGASGSPSKSGMGRTSMG